MANIEQTEWQRKFGVTPDNVPFGKIKIDDFVEKYGITEKNVPGKRDFGTLYRITERNVPKKLK